MTVRAHGEDQYKLTCDGTPPPRGSCQNFLIIENNPLALQNADDWLTRHGWRTIEGKVHYCRFCANRVAVFTTEESDFERRERIAANRKELLRRRW